MLSSSNIDIFDFLFNLLGVEVHKVLLKDLISRLIWFPQVLQDLRNSKLDDWNRNQDSFKNYFSFFHLWPCVTLTYILPTYCWHFSGFILLKTISTFPPSLWKILPAGCRTPSELGARFRAGRLLETAGIVSELTLGASGYSQDRVSSCPRAQDTRPPCTLLLTWNKHKMAFYEHTPVFVKHNYELPLCPISWRPSHL